ncbi:MAG: CHAT domain-containing protein, partial [Planctomycetota bacterium]
EAFDFLERCRAQTLLDGIGSQGAVCSGDLPPELAALEAEARAALVAESARYNAEIRGRQLDGIRSAAAAQHAAFLEYEAVLNRIQRHARRQSSPLFPTRASLEELQGTLDRSDALVFYCLPQGEAYALVVTHDRARQVSLGPTAAILEAVAQLDVPEQDAQTVSGHAKALKKLLIDPLRLPTRVERLLVSPDGRLAHVPFALLAGSRQVAFVPSGTVYVVSAGGDAREGSGVLAYGDPDYQTEREGNAIRVYAGGVALRGLPRTRTEIQAITREGDVTRFGVDAGEAAFRADVVTRERWEAVHFACHGFVNARRPSLSALALTPTDEDDGFLTALEVYGMRIPADLVVLSACSTARGQAVRGGGLLGLSEAFMYAGAPRVVASLWDVDDEATKSFMAAFYRYWRAGESTASSLRKAQLHVKRERRWRHPRYWAAWVLWGLPD